MSASNIMFPFHKSPQSFLYTYSYNIGSSEDINSTLIKSMTASQKRKVIDTEWVEEMVFKKIPTEWIEKSPDLRKVHEI